MKSSHLFSTDAPKVDPKDDQLGRALYCEEIARTLVSWQSTETFVVALSGRWGAGKTTLCNFIKHYLYKFDSEAVVVDFNPWEWSGQDKLFEGFFYEIGAKFGKIDKLAKTRRLLEKWEWLAITLKAGSLISTGLPNWIPGLIGAFVSAGLVSGALLKSWEAIAAAGGVGALALLSSLLDVPEALAKLVQDHSKHKSLDDLRHEIAEELTKLKRPIIVFVDDIDRLTDTEVALLFQLIKANVKLPNLVFFLMYQRSIVAKSMEKLISENGEKYIRKIVQVEWETPTPSDAQIMPMLLSGIDKTINEGKPKIEWDRMRWSSIFNEGLWPYFENLRDINRFIGMFNFYFRLQVRNGVLEVNPVDLIAIEILRAFDNDAYTAVARSKKWLEDIEAPFAKNASLDRATAHFTSIIEREGRSPEKKAALKAVLQDLFPQTLGGQNEQDKFLRSLRICHPDHFHKYFRGALDAENPYASRWAEFLDAMHDQTKVAALISKAIETGKLEEFLTQLWAGKSEIPIQAMLPVTTALFDAGDKFPGGKIGFGMFDPETTTERFIRSRLLTDDKNARTALIKAALTNSTGFSLPIDYIAMEDEAVRNRHPEMDFVVASSEAKWMEEHGLKLIRKKAQDGTLLDYESCGFTLARWSNWASSDEVKQWVVSFVSTPRRALLLLRRLAGKTSTNDEDYQPFLQAEFVEAYFPLEDMKALIDQIPEAELSVEEKKHKQLLDIAVNLKKSGQRYAEVRLPKPSV